MIYGYIRVSTKTQASRGYGLETQAEKIKAYCAANGLELYGIIDDAGRSGTDASREGLTELLGLLDKGDKVVVLNTSRLWRSDMVKVLVTYSMQKLGAEIISIEQPNYTLYTKDPNDFLFNGMLGLLDEYDRLLINRKLAAGRRQRARSGKKPCGVAPYGYRWNNKTIEIEPVKAAVTAEIFEAYKESKSYKIVCERLNLRAISAPRGGEWSRQQVKNIVTNDFYAGVVTHGGRKWKGTQPVIVQQELFLSCNPKYEFKSLLAE